MEGVQSWQIYVHDYMELIGVVILYYDHLITSSDEYHLIWRNTRCYVRLRFIVNRYFAFFTGITVVAGNFLNILSPESCAHYSLYRQLILMVSLMITSYNVFLRVYALYARDKRILALFITSGIVVVIVAVWAIKGQKGSASVEYGCHIGLTQSSANRLAAVWEVLFVFDMLSFALIALRTFYTRRGGWLLNVDDLATLIFRDGATYFVVLACANVANIFTFYWFPPILKGTLSTTVSCISATVLSRMMLNIQKINVSEHGLLAETDLNESTVLPAMLTSRISLPTFRVDTDDVDIREHPGALCNQAITTVDPDII